MDGEWIFEAQLTLTNGGPMEETLIEMFGCVTFPDKVMKVYLSGDKREIRRDLCVGDTVVDTQTTLLPGFLENAPALRERAAVEERLAAA